MQIALVAVVLLAGMWFTVLKPRPASTSPAPVAATPQPVAPGVRGLTSAVDKAKAASTTSDATNARIQAATGGSASSSAPATTATATPKRTTAARKAAATATRKPGTKAASTKAAASEKTAAAKPDVTKTAATAKPAATKTTATKTTSGAAATVDPSDRLLAYLKKGKTLVVLFYGRGADDQAARKAVHQTAQGDPKHVVSAYVPIAQVGDYIALTANVDVLASPTILVIGTNGKATPLTGYADAAVVRHAVASARAAAATK